MSLPTCLFVSSLISEIILPFHFDFQFAVGELKKLSDSGVYETLEVSRIIDAASKVSAVPLLPT
jgi:hypothetical protein